MKKYILLFFLNFAIFGYALGAVGDTVGDEYISVNSATVENVRISYSFKTTKTLKIYNLLGRSVSTVRLTAGTNTVDLTSSLDRGTYVYSIEDAGKSFGAKKFIVK